MEITDLGRCTANGVFALRLAFSLSAQVAAALISFSVHAEIPASAFVRNVTVLPTVTTLQMKQTAVRNGAHMSVVCKWNGM